MNICMKEFISFVELRQLFPYMAFVYAWIVPLWADQLLLQLLMVNICMKDFIIFVCADSTEIFLSKLSSFCSNYNLSSFFIDSYCAGVSNKHCLLTFFIIYGIGSFRGWLHKGLVHFCSKVQ